jgi:hypothetical protein
LRLADIEVLAKNAAQITPGKKNGATPAPTPQAILFTGMGKIAGNLGIAPTFAGGGFIGQPVYTAGWPRRLRPDATARPDDASPGRPAQNQLNGKY